MKSPFSKPTLTFIFTLFVVVILSFASAFPLQPAGTCVHGEGIDDTGDLNLNGIGYEIADYIQFANYFMQGSSAFQPNYRQAQIAASDVNRDGVFFRVSDLTRLVLVLIGDANPLPKANARATPNTAQFQIVQTADSLVIYSNAPVDIRGAFLRLVFTGTIGDPVKLDSASGLDLLYDTTKSPMGLLLLPPLGDTSNGQIPAGNWPILSIPFSGTLEHTEVQASTFDGRELAAVISGAPTSCANLIVESFTLSGPAAATPGDSIGFRLNATIKNTGNLAAGDSFFISFAISQDSLVTLGYQPLLSGQVAIPDLAPGASVNVAIPPEMAIPIDYWPTGPAYIKIVADGFAQINDCDELDNSAYVPVSIESTPASPTDSLIINSVVIYAGQTTVSIPISLTNSVPVASLEGRIIFDSNLVAPKASGFLEWVNRGANLNWEPLGLDCSESGAVAFHRAVPDTLYLIPPGSGIIGRLNLDILTTQDTILCIRLEDDLQPNGYRNLWYYPYYSRNLTFPTLKHGNLIIGAGNAAGACPQTAFKLGDLNLDGGLSPADVVLLLNCLFLSDTWDCPLYLTDTNCDGMATTADIVAMLNAAFLGEIISCP
jgi:hypothetical protein